MILFRIFLISLLAIITVYTLFVIGEHGLNLLPIFFGDMAAMTWPGQFNLDFFTFLLMSGLWVAWRNHFSTSGLGLGVIAVFGGMPFLSIYLMVLSYRHKGDMAVIMLGERRAAA